MNCLFDTFSKLVEIIIITHVKSTLTKECRKSFQKMKAELLAVSQITRFVGTQLYQEIYIDPKVSNFHVKINENFANYFRKTKAKNKCFLDLKCKGPGLQKSKSSQRLLTKQQRSSQRLLTQQQRCSQRLLTQQQRSSQRLHNSAAEELPKVANPAA